MEWTDVTGDGIAEQIKLRPVIRDGQSGFDFGVWDPVGDQYLGDIARMPQTPGMFGYAFSVGPDVDGDGKPELWIADPAAKEFVNGRGCVYIYSWQHSLPLAKLQGPGTDTLGTDIRIQTSDNGQTWSVHAASHFQDIFGHIYQRWSTFNSVGQLQSTEPPSAGVLVLKSGDVDKSLSTNQADVQAVYLKAAQMMEELGITGEKHDEDIDEDDFVDAADILKVIGAVGVPEPLASSLTNAAVYNAPPQRGLSSSGCCTAPCCRTGNCFCIRLQAAQVGVKPSWLASHPGWWKPTGVEPGTVLPPGVYPDRRPLRDPAHPQEDCDGFRVLPGDIELGGIMMPAAFSSSSDSVTARIDNPSVAQFSADDSGSPLPTVNGGDIKLRATLSNAQLMVANGRIKVYGLIPGTTNIIVEFRTRDSNGATQVQEFVQPVKVGGRMEARLKAVRRWSPQNGADSSPWWNAHDAAYATAAASQAGMAPPPFVGTSTIVVPPEGSSVWSRSNRLGTRPGLRGSNSNGDGSDEVRVYDACDELTVRPMAFFTKRLFLGLDSDGDGISDPADTMEGLYLNPQRIEDSIAAGKGPFAGSAFNTPAKRTQAHPGSEIVVVLVGHTAERLKTQWSAGAPVHRGYFFPKVFGDIIPDGRTLPSGQSDFERWAGRDAGTARFTPTYHRFYGVMTQFGRDFAPGEKPFIVNGYQQQAITGATFPVPILNGALYESFERNFNRHEVLGVARLYDPAVTGEYFNETLAFSPLQIFGVPRFDEQPFASSLAAARQWVLSSAGSQLAQQYWQSAGLPGVELHIPMTDQEFRQMLEEIGDGGESAVRGTIFSAEIFLGFVPCGDAVGILFHGGMMIVGDTEDHTVDLLMGVVGLGADLGYVGAVAGVASNGAVAAVRIAIRCISKLDNGFTLKIILKQGDSMLSSLKRLVLYASKYRPEWINAVDLTSPLEVAGAVKRYATELGEVLSNGFSRMAKSRIAQGLSNAVDASGLPYLVKSYEEAVKAVIKGPMDKMASRVLSEQAAEGWSILARLRGVPELDSVVMKLRGSLDLGDDLAKDAADLAVERVGESVRKTLDGGGPHHVHAARDAAANAMRQTDSHLRALVSPHVGPGRAFATAEEFEALRVLPVNKLTEEQVLALKAIRQSVIAIGTGTPIVRTLKLGGPNGALDMIQSGNSRMAGFFSRQSDMVGAASPGEVIQRIRLDFNGAPFDPSLPIAQIETIADAGIASAAKVPTKAGAMGTPPPAGWIDDANLIPQDPPLTGNGFAGSLDGHLTPEWWCPPTPMQPDVTVMKFKNPDGTPHVVSLGQGGASDRWALRRAIDANGVPTFRWEALP